MIFHECVSMDLLKDYRVKSHNFEENAPFCICCIPKNSILYKKNGKSKSESDSHNTYFETYYSPLLLPHLRHFSP